MPSGPSTQSTRYAMPHPVRYDARAGLGPCEHRRRQPGRDVDEVEQHAHPELPEQLGARAVAREGQAAHVSRDARHEAEHTGRDEQAARPHGDWATESHAVSLTGARRCPGRSSAPRPDSGAATTRSPRDGARRASTRATSFVRVAADLGDAEDERVGAELLDDLDLGRRRPSGRELERLRAQAEHDRRRARSPPRRQRHRDGRRATTAPFATGHRAEVHRRRADEAGDERVRRPVVQRARRVALLQAAVLAARRRGGRASSPRTGRA